MRDIGGDGTDADGGCLVEGERVGRFVVVRDLEGRLHALSSSAVSAACETDEGTLLMLPGGRMIHLGQPMAKTLLWLERRPR